MKNKLLIVILILSIAISLLLEAAVSKTKMKLIVPLYMDPSSNQNKSYWQQVSNATSQVNIITIFESPDSTRTDYKSVFQDYVNALTDLKKQNQKNNGSYVIAYVETRNGQRPLSAIQNNILKLSAWPKAYRPDGIYYLGNFDDISTLSYYYQIYDYAKSAFKSDDTIVAGEALNKFPIEVFCSSGVKSNKTCVGKRALDIGAFYYFSLSDFQDNYYESTVNSLNRNRIASFFMNCSSTDDMMAIINETNGSNTGYVFVTDDETEYFPKLPDYFQDEVDAIASLN